MAVINNNTWDIYFFKLPVLQNEWSLPQLDNNEQTGFIPFLLLPHWMSCPFGRSIWVLWWEAPSDHVTLSDYWFLKTWMFLNFPCFLYFRLWIYQRLIFSWREFLFKLFNSDLSHIWLNILHLEMFWHSNFTWHSFFIKFWRLFFLKMRIKLKLMGM